MEKTFFAIFFFVIGTSIGSFLNVLVDRLSKDENIYGRSHCDHCRKKIPWYDLIPVISFYILGGKTRCCHKKLSTQYPLIEAVTGLSFLLIFNLQLSHLNQSSNSELAINIVNLINYFGIISCLIVIFVSDLKYHLISDYVLLGLFIFSAILNLLSVNFIPLLIYFFISSLVVAFPIFLIYFLSHEKAMGLGDVYLAAIMGFLLGWQAGFLALYISFITGAIYGVFLILLKRKKMKSKIAFGPFLVAGTVIMLLWGEKIFEIIKKMYGL